jgi:hypothetical protein
MATQYHEPGQLPDGVVLAHTLYGEPDTRVTHVHTAQSSMGGVQVAPEGSGVPYIGDAAANADHSPPQRPAEREKRCMAKDDTCMGWRITDSEFCAAHAGVFKGPGREDPEKWAARMAAEG